MKRLCLIRHAKSSWNHPSVEDHERPLDERGEEDAKAMGEILTENKVKPDYILASPAKRASDTATLIAESIGFAKDQIITDENLYEAGVEDLLAIIQSLDNKHKSVLLVGHNPGLTYLANYLADDHVVNLPTCGAYCVDFDTNDWSEITVVDGKTVFVDSPKQHH